MRARLQVRQQIDQKPDALSGSLARAIAKLPPSTPDVTASDGAVLLAARRQTVTSLVVLGVPPSAAVPSRTR